MGIPGIGGYGSGNPKPQQTAASADAKSVEQSFLDYIKESPMQRMIDAWLKAHHLSREELQKLPPAQRDAIEKQMAEDIAKRARQKAETLASATGIA